MEKSQPRRNLTGVVRRRVIAYLSVGAGLTVGYAFMRGMTWHGSATLHTVMEAVATLLAVTVGAMALVRFYSRKNNTFLLIGTGFLGTAFLDGYHTVVTSAAFKSFMPADLPALIPWSWVASRQFLSVFLFMSWLVWLREQRLGFAGRISERTVYLFTGIFTLLSFAFFAFAPLPRAYYPEFVFQRPEEFLPALFFLAALAGYLRKGYWRHDMFEHWLVLSLIVGFAGQAVFMSFSGQLFDMEFDLAHLLKKASYVCVLTGLLASMYAAFRLQEERSEAMAKAKYKAESALAKLDQRDTELMAQNERFDAALDNMSQGLCMYDSDKRLVVSNKAFATMYNIPSELLKPGTTLRAILEYRIANGIYAGENPEEYIQERLAWVVRGEQGSKTQRLSDGRTIKISHQPMAIGGWLTTHEDITEVMQAVKAQQESEKQFRNLIEGSIQGVFIARDWALLFANQALADIFGYESPEGVLALDEVGPLLAPEERERILGYKRAREKDELAPEIYESQGLKKDGSIIDIEFRVRQIDWQGAPAMQCVVIDITDRKRAEKELIRHRDHLQELVDIATQELQAKAEELQAALGKEKELNELQRQFVSMASHEFRTPLSIIDGSAQFLAKKGENITTDYLLSRTGKIRDAVKRMTRLMESTLTAARMEEGKIKVEIGACDIGKVVREVCARQQEISKGHVIACDLADLPETIQADTGAVEQVLANLLSNAVKYAPDVPDIEVKAHTQGRHVVISVRDNGIGIDKDDLSRVGERFFRAKTSTGIAGTGIGLNLVNILVEMHGGSVNVESKKGEGSTFTVSLPIAGPDQSEQTDTKAA